MRMSVHIDICTATGIRYSSCDLRNDRVSNDYESQRVSTGKFLRELMMHVLVAFIMQCKVGAVDLGFRGPL